MSKNVLIIGVIVVLLVVGWMVMNGNPSTDLPIDTATTTDNGAATSTTDTSNTGTATTSTQTQGAVKEFVVTGTGFKFDPATMRVKQGDTVRVVFKNAQGTHDWVIDEFNARTKVLAAGQQETIEFVASQKGSFEYYCSVGNHRQMGMKGTLIVE